MLGEYALVAIIRTDPADVARRALVRARSAEIPRDIVLIVAGGVRAGAMRPRLEPGTDGFELRTILNAPGPPTAGTGVQSLAYVDGLRA